MPVDLTLSPWHPVAGVELAAGACGIKKGGAPDLVLARLAEGTTAAALFTRSHFRAAPVTVGRANLEACGGRVRALVVNSGNANAGTGEPGIEDARRTCEAAARALGVPAASVLPFSTGVIGQRLPIDRLGAGIEALAGELGEHWEAAARAIMTTDTVPKLASRRVEVGGATVTLTGMCKGSGMIRPDMATMLAYVFTDAALDAADLDAALRAAAADSFNAISVDGDTSTNDALVLCATGAGPRVAGEGLAPFGAALGELCLELAQAIVRDGEGATKFVTVRVTGGATREECRAVAYAIADSPLVKTAAFASDANVGRLLMAIGKARLPGDAPLDAAGVTVSVGGARAFERGGVAEGYTEARGAAAFAGAEIDVAVDLGRGAAEARVYASDLSHEYVSVNADYRS